ncbi:hypothetical protein [Deinococcus kurensis]|uniref:hypothetical protein n=1 Tax=Deinococcus kurensis TaxID=2662757 RepID=UPI0012D2BADD|nr:hypothetical protein [Deinococcus kurensis]
MQYPARSFTDAIRALDPQKPLDVSEPTERTLFVDRNSNAIDTVTALLHVGEEVKVLFSGHRGTGKSTELSRLATDLNTHWVIRFSVREKLDVPDLNYLDIVIAVALQLLHKADQDKLSLPSHLERRIEQLGKDITREIENSEGWGVTVKGGLAEKFFNLFSLEGRLNREAVTRLKVRENVGPRLSEVSTLIGELALEIQRLTGRIPLVICEDIDKADTEKAVLLFAGHGSTLNDLPVSIVYTFPIALQNHQKAAQILATFSEKVTLPNFKLFNQDRTPCLENWARMGQLLDLRVDPTLSTPAARQALIQASGGIPRSLMRLARDAFIQATIRKVSVMDELDAESAIRKERRNFQRILSREQLEELAAINTTQQIDTGQALHLELLDNLSVLEYENGSVWYGVNPVVVGLLPTTI